MPKSYRIGDLASRLSVTVETIRYYEKEGLLPPAARTESNYRLYSDTERQRLEFIVHCRALDMSQQEIRQLLALRDKSDGGCADVNAILDGHIEHVAGRLRALKRLQAELRTIRARCEEPGSIVNCGALRELGTNAKRRKSASRSGVH